VAVLLACGFRLDLAARAYAAVAHYVVGFALQQHAPGAPQPEDAAKLRDFYRALDAETYPATVAAADELTSVPLSEEFRFGLQLVLDGSSVPERRPPKSHAVAPEAVELWPTCTGMVVSRR